MKTLEVRLDYQRVNSSNLQPRSGNQAGDLVLPLRVMDSDGSVVAEAAVGCGQPTSLDVSKAEGNLFVRLTWPSGKFLTKKVVDSSETGEVVFSDDVLSRHEWAAWAVPRLNEHVDVTAFRSNVVQEPQKLSAFEDATIAFWRYGVATLGWELVPIRFENIRQDDATLQFDMELPDGGWLMQLRGDRLNTRFISLPWGRCRVLITPNLSTDPRADGLKAVVTGFRQDAENLLEYLSRDSLRAADSLASYDNMAVRLFRNATSDPLAAVAGGYYLARTDYWRKEGVVEEFSELHRNFPAIADTALLYLTVLVRNGLATPDDEAEARLLFAQAERLAYPVYSEAMRLFQEVSSILRVRKEGPDDTLVNTIQNLVAANAWAGSSFSFYGEEPGHPAVPHKSENSPERMPMSHFEIRLGNLINSQSNLDVSAFFMADTHAIEYAHELGPAEPM